MSNNDIFNLLELAVILTALQERLERLEEEAITDDSVKLLGEILPTKSAISTIEKLLPPFI